MIQMTHQTPKMVTKWLSYEPVHTRVKGACKLACMHCFFHLHRHVHHKKLSNTIKMMPQTLPNSHQMAEL